jgi:hypothetical protein
MITPFRLYFFYQRNCGACATAEPYLKEFLKEHPEGLVIRKDANKGQDILGYLPGRTPGYGLALDGKIVLTHEGVLDAGDLDQMLIEALGGDSPDDDDPADDEEDAKVPSHDEDGNEEEEE